MSNADMVATSTYRVRSYCERRGHTPILDDPAGCPDVFRCAKCDKAVTSKGDLIGIPKGESH
jgi:hypothetical protein